MLGLLCRHVVGRFVQNVSHIMTSCTRFHVAVDPKRGLFSGVKAREMETVVCLLLIGCLVNIFNRLLLREKISFAEIYIL